MTGQTPANVLKLTLQRSLFNGIHYLNTNGDVKADQQLSTFIFYYGQADRL